MKDFRVRPSLIRETKDDHLLPPRAALLKVGTQGGDKYEVTPRTGNFMHACACVRARARTCDGYFGILLALSYPKHAALFICGIAITHRENPEAIHKLKTAFSVLPLSFSPCPPPLLPSRHAFPYCRKINEKFKLFNQRP